MTNGQRYRQTYRRTLLDMHGPDRDKESPSQCHPEKLAELYESINVPERLAEAVALIPPGHMGTMTACGHHPQRG